MQYIFISHDPEDSDFAETLRREMEGIGFATRTGRGGLDQPEEIDRAIRESTALIVVMTPKAKASETVMYEWAFALGVGVNVITVLLKPTELPSRLDGLQQVDFTGHPAAWNTLFGILQKTTGIHIPHANFLPDDTPPIINQLMDALNSTEPADRKAAVEELAKIDHPVARETLAGATRHAARDVRIHAAFMLAPAKDARAVPGLLEATHDMDPNHRVGKAVVEALRKITPYGLPGEAATVGLAAGWALRRMGENAIPGLLDALRSEKTGVRMDAVEWMGEIGEVSAVPGLLKALHDQEWHIRQGAAEALGKIGDKSAMSGLLEALLDANDKVRGAAAEALGEIRNEAAIPGLAEALNDESSEVYQAVVRALKHVGTSDALNTLKKWHQR